MSEQRVLVTRSMLDPSAGLYALVYMQVCAVADATHEEVLDVCNRENPSGTTNGWSSVVGADDEHENLRPVPCQDMPGRIHYLVSC